MGDVPLRTQALSGTWAPRGPLGHRRAARPIQRQSCRVDPECELGSLPLLDAPWAGRAAPSLIRYRTDCPEPFAGKLLHGCSLPLPLLASSNWKGLCSPWGHHACHGPAALARQRGLWGGQGASHCTRATSPARWCPGVPGEGPAFLGLLQGPGSGHHGGFTTGPCPHGSPGPRQGLHCSNCGLPLCPPAGPRDAGSRGEQDMQSAALL